MSQQVGDYPPSPATSAPTGQVARDQAGEVGRTAVDAGREVAGTATEQAGNVVGEVKAQSRDLLGEVRSQVQDQARTGQQKAADGVRAVAQELREMVEGSNASGPTAQLAGQAADRGDRLATWLGDREPGDLVEEVRSFARRRPWLFLAGAAAAGVVAGRLTRGAVDSARSDSATDSAPADSALTDSGTAPGPRHAYGEPARSIAAPTPQPHPGSQVGGLPPAAPAYPAADVPTPPRGTPPVPSAVPAPPASPLAAEPTPDPFPPSSGVHPPGGTVGDYGQERERHRDVADERLDDPFRPENGGGR